MGGHMKEDKQKIQIDDKVEIFIILDRESQMAIDGIELGLNRIADAIESLAQAIYDTQKDEK